MRAGQSRRTFLLGALGTGATLRFGAGQGSPIADPRLPPQEAHDFITSETQQAIDRGLAYLGSAQNADGSYGRNDPFRANVAVTSLAALAFMSAGHHPGRGAYGGRVLKALNYVLGKEKKSPAGYFHNDANDRQVGMYDHGFATLFLSEVYGMVPYPDLKGRLKGAIGRAVRLIESSQNEEGGWRYDPAPHQADVSVTICQVMALRAARNAGFAVGKPTIDLCVKYVRSCQNADGGYSYFNNQGGSAFARSAAGLVALYSAGIYEGREVDRTLRYLMQFRPNSPLARREVPDMHWYYGQYYAAQAMWTAALRQPKYWNEWFPALRDELLLRVRGRRDGAWPDSTVGDQYATAMALISLQIPNNYLPILQK